MSLEWIEEPVAFTRDWSKLVERDPDGTFFHTSRYLQIYRESLAPARTSIAVVGDPEDPDAVCAFEIEGDRIAFLGGLDVTDYLGPVGIPARRESSARQIAAALAEREDWKEADLRGLPEDGQWLNLLGSAFRDAGLEPLLEPEIPAPFLQLQPSYEEYLGSLAGKLRHEIRRKRRRLLDRFPDARLVDATEATVGDDLDLFIELHRASPGEKGGFMTPRMEAFFRRLADKLLPDGTLRLSMLRAGDEILAGAIGFRDRDRFLLYNSAFDPDRGAISPGMVMLDLLIEDTIREGFRAMDMLKGDVDYKYRFGAHPRRLYRIVVRRD